MVLDFISSAILDFSEERKWLPMANLYLFVHYFGQHLSTSPGSPDIKTGACSALVAAIYNVISNDEDIKNSVERYWVSATILYNGHFA